MPEARLHAGPHLLIRPAADADLAGLSRVLSSAFSRLYAGVFGSRAEDGVRVLLETLHDDWRQALVAEVDGEVAGTVFLLFAGERARWSRGAVARRLVEALGGLRALGALLALTWLGEARPPARRGEIHLLAVDPRFQRRGLGRALLEAAFAEARRRQVSELRLWAAGNNAAARALYQACGFRVRGWMPVPGCGPLFGFWTVYRLAAPVPEG